MLRDSLLTGLLSCLLPAAVLAGTGDCHAIKDADQRRYCLGLTRKSSGDCYAVRQPDLRQLCLAQVKGQTSHCHSIRQSDQRRLCLALVR